MSNESMVMNAVEELEKERIAADSVSYQIAKLIPYLKQRQHYARNLDKARTSEEKGEIRKVLQYCNVEIKKILGL